MFEINFRIIEDIDLLRKISLEEFDDEYHDLEGFFSLNFDGNVYGYYHENELKVGEQGFDWILRWFEDLIKAFYLLDSQQYVAINVIESYSTWIEFVLKGHDLIVSLIKNENKVGRSSIVTEPFDEFSNYEWKIILISKEEFRTELFKKVNLLIKEVNEINPVLIKSKAFQRLLGLLRQCTI